MVHRRVRATGALGLVFVLAAVLAGGCGRPGRAPAGPQEVPHFEPGFNIFTPEQDVEMGRVSALQITREMPVLADDAVQAYVKDVGRRLAERAPGEKFPYTFTVLNARELNAFALPGGHIFVNRGTLDAAQNEGELAGVLAHEISHVALRHGTSQASKAYLAKAGLGILAQIASGGGEGGSISGDIVAAIGGLGLNTLFLKFGRTAETQADLTGATIMAEAGYDPLDMAAFFKKLAERGGQGVPEFLSDHPDPGNRVRSIEAVRPNILVTGNPIRDTEGFRAVKARLRGLGSAPSRQARALVPSGGSERPPPPSGSTVRLEAPSRAFSIAYPDNWDAVGDRGEGDNAAFAPRGGYGQLQGQLVFTHGVLVGTADTGGSDLESATQAFVDLQLHDNPEFEAKEQQRAQIGARPGLATLIGGPSPVTGVAEADVIYTTILPDGRLFYLITVVPRDEIQAYQPAFEQILGSLRFAE